MLRSNTRKEIPGTGWSTREFICSSNLRRMIAFRFPNLTRTYNEGAPNTARNTTSLLPTLTRSVSSMEARV